MKMGWFEKYFVNRTSKKRNIIPIERILSNINLKEVNKVMEVACGAGFLSKYLAQEHKWNVIGIDVDPKQIERANKYKEDIPNVHYYEANVQKLPFEDNSFDMIVSIDAFHHIIGILDVAINEIVRVLKPGGYFVLIDILFPKNFLFKKYRIPIEKIFMLLDEENHSIVYKKLPNRISDKMRFKIICQKGPIKGQIV